jgi:hypothetical protein
MHGAVKPFTLGRFKGISEKYQTSREGAIRAKVIKMEAQAENNAEVQMASFAGKKTLL